MPLPYSLRRPWMRGRPGPAPFGRDEGRAGREEDDQQTASVVDNTNRVDEVWRSAPDLPPHDDVKTSGSTYQRVSKSRSTPTACLKPCVLAPNRVASRR